VCVDGGVLLEYVGCIVGKKRAREKGQDNAQIKVHLITYSFGYDQQVNQGDRRSRVSGVVDRHKWCHKFVTRL
jgi:hypothetical protein